MNDPPVTVQQLEAGMARLERFLERQIADAIERIEHITRERQSALGERIGDLGQIASAHHERLRALEDARVVSAAASSRDQMWLRRAGWVLGLIGAVMAAGAGAGAVKAGLTHWWSALP